MKEEKTDHRTTAERTEHPELFAETYWGNFRDDEIGTDIIANRNVFAEQIEKPSRLNRGTHAITNFDHFEGYRLKSGKGFCAIVSNYRGAPPEAFGMRRTCRLYSSSCETYIGMYPTRKDFNARVRQYQKDRMSQKI